jgi:hypothetical protein
MHHREFRRWTEFELVKLRALAKSLPAHRIAASMGRTPAAVAAKACQLKLPLRTTSENLDRCSEPGPAGFSWPDFP